MVFDNRVTIEEMVGGEVCDLGGLKNDGEESPVITSARALAALGGVGGEVSVG